MECKRKDCYFAHQDAWDPHQTKAQKDRRKPKSVVLEANQAGMSKEEEASNLSHPPFAYNAISGLRIIRRTPLFASLSSLTK